MQQVLSDPPFTVSRLGVLMSPSSDAREAWGVINPGGTRAPDGETHIFPRIIAEGNYSRIAHALVRHEVDAPTAVERLGIALEPLEAYECGPRGGGVEDPRVTFVSPLGMYVMTYTAYVPFEPRVAIAISKDLQSWTRLGILRYAAQSDIDLNKCGNKDAAFLPEAVLDGNGVQSLAILHRPTTSIAIGHSAANIELPPSGEEKKEDIWISYIPLESAVRDVNNLTLVGGHEEVMAPVQQWEHEKVGAGAPPIRMPYGWLMLYHAVSISGGRRRYCMGAAVFDLDRPSRVLYRSPVPLLEPEADYECTGADLDVVFPTATDLRSDGSFNVYYGAGDRQIAAARLTVPRTLPSSAS